MLKISPDIIDCNIANIRNKVISNNKFSENAKTATVRSIFKRGNRTEMKTYSPVSLLNIFKKKKKLTNYVDTFLSKFISACRKSYTCNHVLIRLLESWKKSLDQKKFVGAVLMDLSKAFDAILHNLFIAKMHA